jgi:hypothetical protein
MSFDLNIQNYTLEELQEMFQLPNQYDILLLETQEQKLRNTITRNQNMDKGTREQTLGFLVKAKEILLQKKNTISSSTFENNLLDCIHSNYEMTNVAIQEPTRNDHMVQQKKETHYISSNPSEYFSGIINPLKRRTIKKNINIDSRFRENYYITTASNFSITLPTFFNNVFTVQLASIELPNTFTLVSKHYGNDFFCVKIGGGQATIVTIPEGNYTETTLLNTIQSALIALPITITQTSNQKVLIQTTPTNTFELNFQTDRFGNEDNGTALPLKLGWILGFRNGIYIQNTEYFSEGQVNVSGPQYLYLVVDDFNNNVTNGFYSAFHSSVLNNNILARISLSPGKNSSIVSTQRDYFGPINIKNLTVQLLDEYGRIVDLNYADLSFCLTLTLQYDL